MLRSVPISPPHEGEHGFTLLEVMVSILLSLLLVTISTQFSANIWNATKRTQLVADKSAAMSNADRILSFDGHQAVSVGRSLGHLVLRTVAGNQYTYLANPQHQFVRIQSGGGTSVIASGIVDANVSVTPGWFSESLIFVDGSTEEVHVCTLVGLSAAGTGS